jgi:ketosteroid isomerase-like protein
VHVQLAERIYQALLASDVASLRPALTERSTWELHGRSPLAGLHTGADRIAEVLERLTELLPISPDAYDVMVSEHHATLTTRLVAEGLDSDHAFVIVAAEDGTLARAFHYVFDLYAFDAFFAQ